MDGVNLNDSPAKEDEVALEAFYRDLKFADGRYEIRWPWRSFPPNLPNNYALAIGRLRSLHRKLNMDRFSHYDLIIQTQLESGIIEKVPEEEIRSSSAFYLSHRAVITPGKSTPMRIVYDGSAKSSRSGKSLNDEIYKGSNLLLSSIEVLIRFRAYLIAFVSDIEKAFLQLSVNSVDRDYIRFLWFSNYHADFEKQKIVVYRFKRVPFGVVASPFLLHAILHHHIVNSELDLDIINLLLKSFYADNFCSGVYDFATACKVYSESVGLFSKCSMNLRNWATNDSRFRSFLPEDKRETAKTISLLGLTWDLEKDTLNIKSFKPVSAPFTLGNILAATASFYDPCGFFEPLRIRAKFLIQDIQTPDTKWDDPIEKKFAERWENIQNDLSRALTRSIPRLITSFEKTAEYELHVFADASARAYAAVAYVRSVSDNSIKVELICAKSRVVRPNLYTIPKLELMAVVLATRLVELCRSAFPISFEHQFIWSDSSCVLGWLKNSRKILPVFVRNRVEKIRQCKDIIFRYVPGNLNPADIPTRGPSFTDTEFSSWWSGTDFLTAPPLQWPADLNNLPNIELIEPEPRQNIYQVSVTPYMPPFDIDCTRYSDFIRVIRITACIIRFLRKVTTPDNYPVLHSHDRAAQVAEILWLKAEQQFHYAVIRDLSTNRDSQFIKKWGLFLDAGGLIRCAHRLKNAPLPEKSKFPILLPNSKHSHYTKLLVLHFHQLVYHQGTAYTLNALRKEFWLPRGQATVSSIVIACSRCKKFTARPFPQPDNSHLPSFRLTTECYPFLYIGVDTCGPLMVGLHKYNILVITDLVCRAVDLEVLDDMTTNKLLLAFRRFVARRTKPQFVVSDNAAQFKLLEEVFQASVTGEFVWKYIPEFSQWQGGVYERMVGIVKQSLFRTFHGIIISASALRTAIAEIAAMLNSRPLTYVSEDQQDTPITPNDFLKSKFTLPDEILPPSNPTPTAAQLVRIWRQSQEAVNVFWNVWRTAYLQSLRTEKRPYAFPRNTSVEEPRVGHVVLIADKKQKRHKWRIGRITQLNVSEDGEIRSATLKLGDRSPGVQPCKCEEITRPMCDLYPLELPEEDLSPSIPHPNATPQIEDQPIEEEVIEINLSV